MTTFLNGPAAGQHLMLKRTSKFLRVTECNGKWDGLDLPDDIPRSGEKLYAYRLAGRLGTIHINMGRGRGGFYPVATYQLVKEQPSDAVMRDPKQWAEWSNGQ